MEEKTWWVQHVIMRVDAGEQLHDVLEEELARVGDIGATESRRKAARKFISLMDQETIDHGKLRDVFVRTCPYKHIKFSLD